MNIQVHDAGIVTGLLKNRPFLLGEIFIQDTTKNLKASNYLRDKLTGAPIMRLQEGDLYGGCNEWYGGLSGNAADATENGITKSVHPHIYQLGSGSALKFANHLLYKFADADNNILNEVYTELSNNPNTLYLYVGPKGSSDPIKSEFANSEVADTKLFQKLVDGEKQKFEVIGDAENTHHLGDTAVYQSLANRIDSGDLVFYSAVYKQVFIWHLSRSQASLVRFNYNELQSKSLNKEFATELNAGTYSLKSFLDKVGRQFQRLTDEGWIEATTAYDGTDILARVPNTIKEGNVVYIPFIVAGDYINPEDELTVSYPTLDELDVANSAVKVLPGDLLFAVPSTDGKFKLVKVSLLSEFLKRMSLKSFNTLRADQYARDRWETDEAEDNYESKDSDFITDIQKGIKKLPDLLNRFGATKADIDPKTGKIITSQIPSFILGGLKRVNTFTLELLDEAIATESAPQEGIDPTKKGEVLAALLTKDWELDDDGNITYKSAEDFDRQTLDNMYFIWQDGPYEITTDNPFFVKRTPNDVDDGNVEVVKEINNGDMLIYNGDLKKFEVIDNSSELISLIVDGKHVVGTPTLTPKTSDRESNFKVVKTVEGVSSFDDEAIFTDGEVEEVSIDVENPDSGDIVFGNPHGVIFAESEEKAFVDANHLPIINSKGVAYNSLFSFLQNADEDGHDSGLKLELQKRGLQFINTDFDYSPINEDDNFNWIFAESEVEDPNSLKAYYELNRSQAGHLWLPNVHGVLATEEEILAAVQFLLDAIKEALDTYALSGTEDYLQTIYKDEDGKKYLKDSAISFDSHKADTGVPADASIIFHPGDEKGENTHNGTTETNEIIVQSKNTNIRGHNPDWHQEITVVNGIPKIPEAQLALPAKGQDSAKIQNILPNFDGTLINSNSIIFCGYWTDPDPEA